MLPSGRYRHFKGNEYELLYTARHSETLEEMIVYRALYGEGGIWVRPAAMWDETIERDGQVMQRFTYIAEMYRRMMKNGLSARRVITVTVLLLALLVGCGSPPPSSAIVPPPLASSSAPVSEAPSMPPASSAAPAPSSAPAPAASTVRLPNGAEHPLGVIELTPMPTIPLADGVLLELDLPVSDIAQIQQLLFLDGSRLYVQYQTDETYDDSGVIRNRSYIARIDLDTGRVVNRFGGNQFAPLSESNRNGSRMEVIAPDTVLTLDSSLASFTTRATDSDAAYRKRMTETGGVACYPQNDGWVSVDDRTLRLADEKPLSEGDAHPSGYRNEMKVTLPSDCSAIRFAGSMHNMAIVTVKGGKLYLLRDCKELPTAQALNLSFAAEHLALRSAYPAYRTTDFRVSLTVNNWNQRAVQLGRDFYLEQWNDSGWDYYHYSPHNPGSLDNPGVQMAVMPDEQREIGVYIGDALQDGKLPAGRYRLTILYGEQPDQVLRTEFTMVDSAVEHPASGRYTIKVDTPVIKGTEDMIPFTIQNHTNSDAAYGMSVGLQRQLDGNWTEVKPIEPIGVPDIAIMLPAQKSNADSLSLIPYKRPLPAGRYRIVKEVGEILYSEFEVKP